MKTHGKDALINITIGLLMCQVFAVTSSWGLPERCELLTVGNPQWVDVGEGPSGGGMCELRIRVSSEPQVNTHAYVVQHWAISALTNAFNQRLSLSRDSFKLQGLQNGELVFYELDVVDAAHPKKPVYTLSRMKMSASSLGSNLVDLVFSWPLVYKGAREEKQSWRVNKLDLLSMDLVLNQIRQNDEVLTTLKIHQINVDGTHLTHEYTMPIILKSSMPPIEFRLGLIESDFDLAVQDEFNAVFTE